MHDLIFCCPRCLKISTAASVDDQAILKCRDMKIPVHCPHCRESGSVAMTDMMRTASMRDDGEFAAITLQTSVRS